jgi:hypothetical protein
MESYDNNKMIIRLSWDVCTILRWSLDFCKVNIKDCKMKRSGGGHKIIVE